MGWFFKTSSKEDIIRIESGFPLEIPHGFHNIEINMLFDSIPTMASYTPSVSEREGYPGQIGITEECFVKRKSGYLNFYKNTFGAKNKDKIKYLEANCKIKANLAHTSFLSQAYILNPYFTKMKIPFVFTLYPGGGFGLNNEASDNNLREIFSNKYFRKVIVNYDITYDYLVENNLCPEEKIEMVFGVPLQFKKNEVDLSKKNYYKKDKDTFDICFVAFKYDDIGKSKGYDLFIAAAKKLLSRSTGNKASIRFHVIGNINKDVIDITVIKDSITFYGTKTPNWLNEFYYNMDIVVAPVRPNLLYPGSFDGYLMCGEQSLCGVAMFQSDELNINRDYHYFKRDEIVHIELDAGDISSKIEFYFNNLDKLYDLADRGRKKTQLLCDSEDRAFKIKQILMKVLSRQD